MGERQNCFQNVWPRTAKNGADQQWHRRLGKKGEIPRYGKTIFKNIKNPFEAGRYHSLVVDRDNFPAILEIIAETEQKEIMALRHREYSVWGLQFHPESILTDEGKRILKNFINVRPDIIKD